MKNFIDIKQFTKKDLITLVELARVLKREHKACIKHAKDFSNKTLALLFEKPSTRTRVSFEVGMKQFNGNVVTLQKDEVGLGDREPIKDVARVLSRYVDIIMIRTFEHSNLTTFSEYATIPVINGLSDLSHPCQAVADFLTIYETFGTFEGVKITYLGDGNNVCRSLLEFAQIVGADMVVSTPDGYDLDFDKPYRLIKDAKKAIEGAQVVYTDTWVSMGEEGKGIDAFNGYQINDALMSLANKDAIFMHCLPAHRGEEVTNDVMESTQSKIFDQAENRLHAQKAILQMLLS